MSLPPAELQWLMSSGDPNSACPGLAALHGPDDIEPYCSAGSAAHVAPALLAVKSAKSVAVLAVKMPAPEIQSSWVPGLLGFAAGAAVVTAVAALKNKKRTSSELYVPLAEDTA
jgi:hypothetical protein